MKMNSSSPSILMSRIFEVDDGFFGDVLFLLFLRLGDIVLKAVFFFESGFAASADFASSRFTTEAFRFLALSFFSLVGIFPFPPVFAVIFSIFAAGFSAFLLVRSITSFFAREMGFLVGFAFFGNSLSIYSSESSSSSSLFALEFESESSTLYLTCFDELLLIDLALAGGASPPSFPLS